MNTALRRLLPSLAPCAALALAVSPAAAQELRDAAAGPSATPAAASSDLRFDLARLEARYGTGGGRTERASRGADVPVSSRAVAGIEADFTANGLALAGGGMVAEGHALTFRQEARVTGRLGVLVDRNALVYGRVGYAQRDGNDGLTGPVGRLRSLAGVVVGVGSEVRLSPDLSIRTEYRYVDYAANVASTDVVSGLALRF